MQKGKVSVIVPVCNAGLYIERCVRSVIGQTYKNVEIILIDDGSVDNSFVLCESMQKEDGRICIYRQSNRGVVRARKTGIENSHGEYLLFVDADDWIEQDMVEELINNIDKADIISSGIYWEKYPGDSSIYVDDYEEGIYQFPDHDFFSRLIFDLEKRKLQPFTPWMVNKLFRKDLVLSVYKDWDDMITFAEDSTFLYKCLFRARSIVILHKPFYHYCFNESSVCHQKQINMLSDINKVYVSLYEECRNRNEKLLEQLQDWIILMARVALNERMRFQVETHIPEFLLDIRGLMEKQNIVIYGAGQAGQDYYHQLKKLGYDITLWIDSNYEYWKGIGMDVHKPEDISGIEYDVILIAVSSKNAMMEIRERLREIGVEDRKIMWKKPICY